MAFPLIFHLVAAGAAASMFRQVHHSNKTLDKAIDENSFAKTNLENMEIELDQARKAARESLLKLGRLRQEIWAGTMSRFLTCYRRLENLESESAPLAGMVNFELLNESQLAVIAWKCQQAQEDFLRNSKAQDSTEKNSDDKVALLPKYQCNAPPNHMGFDSVIDLDVTLCVPGLAEQRLKEAKENVTWAEKLDDEFLASETARKTWQVQEAAVEYNILLESLATKLNGILTNLEITMAKKGVDYQQYSPENRRLALLATSFGKTLLPLLENPVITGTGELCPGQEKAPAAGRALLAEMAMM